MEELLGYCWSDKKICEFAFLVLAEQSTEQWENSLGQQRKQVFKMLIEILVLLNEVWTLSVAAILFLYFSFWCWSQHNRLD